MATHRFTVEAGPRARVRGQKCDFHGCKEESKLGKKIFDYGDVVVSITGARRLIKAREAKHYHKKCWEKMHY